MKNNFSKIVPVAAFLLLVVPQIAFAAWWNPISWSVWGAIESIFVGSPQPVTVATSTPDNTAIPTLTNTGSNKDTQILPTRTTKSVGTSIRATQPKQTAISATTQTPAAPTQPQAPVVSSQQLQTAIANYQAQTALNYLQTMIPQLLTIAQSEQTEFSNSIQSKSQSRQNCQQMAQQAATAITNTYQQSTQNAQYTGGVNTQNYITGAQGAISPSALGFIQNQTQTLQQEMQQNEQSALASNQSQENLCLSQFPEGSDSSVLQQLTQVVNQLNTLSQQVQNNPTSASDVASLVQQYNSLESQVIHLNGELPTPVLPVSFPTQASAPTVGNVNCSLSGSSFMCIGPNTNTDCAISGSSINCIGARAGQNMSCTGVGGSLNCVSY